MVERCIMCMDSVLRLCKEADIEYEDDYAFSAIENLDGIIINGLVEVGYSVMEAEKMRNVMLDFSLDAQKKIEIYNEFRRKKNEK